MSEKRTLVCLAFATAGATLSGVIGVPGVAMLGNLLNNVAGNLAYDLYKDNADRLVQGVFQQRPGIDENHHIIIALRKAHLEALGEIRSRFALALMSSSARESTADQRWFSDQVSRFLNEAGLGKPAGSGMIA